jgi:predicted nucleic acid-binding protein
MIVDTDVLVWYFRGNEQALAELLDKVPFSISCITLMELMQGALNKREQNTILKQLEAWDIEVLKIDESISSRAIQFVKDFSLSHGVTIADALIAATAYDRHSGLITANTKHFEFLPGLRLQKFTP